MVDTSSETNWVGVGLTVLVFFVIPFTSLLVGGEAPIFAFGLLVVGGTFILLFKREWWWLPLREYVSAGGDRRSEKRKR